MAKSRSKKAAPKAKAPVHVAVQTCDAATFARRARMPEHHEGGFVAWARVHRPGAHSYAQWAVFYQQYQKAEVS